MAEPLNISISVAERTYRMVGIPAQDETYARDAARMLNELLKKEQQKLSYQKVGYSDRQDLLAMVAVKCMIEVLKLDEQHRDLQKTLFHKLGDLDALCKSVLSD